MFAVVSGCSQISLSRPDPRNSCFSLFAPVTVTVTVKSQKMLGYSIANQIMDTYPYVLPDMQSEKKRPGVITEPLLLMLFTSLHSTYIAQ